MVDGHFIRFYRGMGPPIMGVAPMFAVSFWVRHLVPLLLPIIPLLSLTPFPAFSGFPFVRKSETDEGDIRIGIRNGKEDRLRHDSRKNFHVTH